MLCIVICSLSEMHFLLVGDATWQGHLMFSPEIPLEMEIAPHSERKLRFLAPLDIPHISGYHLGIGCQFVRDAVSDQMHN